ncbi:hypothetical protein Hdeb2414_s0012g00384041 [Helianthus debilis subsp. tardiflorus]
MTINLYLNCYDHCVIRDICLSCCALDYVIVVGVVHKFQFQLDSLAFSLTYGFILSSACCIHLYSVQIDHNLAAIRLLHSLLAFRYCCIQILSSDCSCCSCSPFT